MIDLIWVVFGYSSSRIWGGATGSDRNDVRMRNRTLGGGVSRPFLGVFGYVVWYSTSAFSLCGISSLLRVKWYIWSPKRRSLCIYPGLWLVLYIEAALTFFFSFLFLFFLFFHFLSFFLFFFFFFFNSMLNK
jgi:hypothetical protein